MKVKGYLVIYDDGGWSFMGGSNEAVEPDMDDRWIRVTLDTDTLSATAEDVE
jgi:hypothetical protein